MKSKFFLWMFVVELFSVSLWAVPALQSQQPPAAEQVFASIEQGMSSGDISGFADYFSNQAYLSLSGGYNGYCSASQAFYILQNYLKLHQPVQFKFTTINTTQSPYSTGVYTYEMKNKRGTSQVFISLRFSNNKWFISQFTIR
ncbi:MAG: DUF4783 domain-containing protein [Ignavibacteriales bacterium]|nr:DUF4783 domain-containing protein [Ignavibacteriales bacterium]